MRLRRMSILSNLIPPATSIAAWSAPSISLSAITTSVRASVVFAVMTRSARLTSVKVQWSTVKLTPGPERRIAEP